MLPSEARISASTNLNASFGGENISDGGRVDELDEAVLGRGGQNSVGRQLQIKVFLLQDSVHQGDDLEVKW